VVLWLGAFPRWFPATLRSFEANCNIDFYFFSDNLPTDLPPNIPPNCHFPFLNKTQFETLASRKFGKPIRLRAGYKLCDWRPALGHLFEELLRPYAFWGWCDIDTIWGQPRKWLTPEVLNAYDVFSPWAAHPVLGPFTVLRNNEVLRFAYKLVPNLWEYLQHPAYEGLDEWIKHPGFNFPDTLQKLVNAGLLRQWPGLGVMAFNDCVLHRDAVHQNDVGNNFFCMAESTKVIWNADGLHVKSGNPQQDTEIMYYHFQLSKDSVKKTYHPQVLEQPAMTMSVQGFEVTV
jgi:hypothetical protein